MFLKYSLIGLGSAGVVGGGGYMIYDATKSENEDSKTIENSDKENDTSSGEEKQNPPAQSNQQAEPQSNSENGNTKSTSSKK